MRYWPVTLLLLSSLVAGLSAADDHPFESPSQVDPKGGEDSKALVDLWQLFQEAELEDPRIQIAHAQSEGGRWREREALGQLLPQLNASGAFNRSLQDNEVTRDFYNGERYALTLSQTLYDPETWHNYRRFSDLALQRKAEYEVAQEEATIDLVERYFSSLAAEDELELVSAELRATERNLERVQSLYARQLALITDVLEISSRVDALRAAEIRARSDIEVSREALSELVGRTINERLKRIGDQTPFVLPTQGREYWVEHAMGSSPVLQARRSAVDAAQAALKMARGGHAPKASLSLSGQRSDIGYENSNLANRTDTYVASLGVQVPIFSGGSVSARVAAGHADLMAAEHEFEQARRQVIREVRSAYYAAEAGVSKIAASRKALLSSQRAREAAERAFGYGVMNAIDVLNAIKEEYMARRDLLKAQYDFVMSNMVLRRWSGTLIRSDVHEVNKWLVAPTLEGSVSRAGL
ncbi:channel protein TolC [Pseudomonas sp. Choline-3u-10]|jgi:outer membrane protein|uniref:TolC family outer membrane protein n=1 Tax=Pseudomonadaceae TaxID=135621 RepID=UPI0009E192E1|nr:MULTISPECIES: TolC family outer membrane protein [Pseudomonadaceae]MAL35009.1 channel protein TolC [Pseudomonas sp.]MBU0948988.1 TolC family outer membrane protein [Gammaproteobacteria bacterium]MBK3796785.1 TolC family outer membrane protein [Stutzerimonas stutzeri]MBK3877288.1 TolC family outer membrane protein [Stutzerimonas stutzeri]PKG95266.1 channel protein TolC [Pseudomonas sp. Choline-3u-10]|tara:strand:- start:769 stop:2175 length:1407 start_codon:yes stop_codon:yes gene_type:complete